MWPKTKRVAVAMIALYIVAGAQGAIQGKPSAGPSYVDRTWMSIANMYYEVGTLGIITDGYITRIPQSEFYGGGGGLAYTRRAYRPDVDAVTRVMNAIGGPSKINLLLTIAEARTVHGQVAS